METNFSEAEQKWIPLIGQYIFDFASIEDSIHRVITFYLRKNIISEDDLNDDFKKKLKLFEKIMKKEILENLKDIEALVEVVKEIDQLRNTRNLVAHNSIGLTFKEAKNGEMKMIGFEISGKRKKASINYETLRNHANKLRKARIAFTKLMMAFEVSNLSAMTRETTAELLRSKK